MNRCVSKEILPVYVKAGSILPFGPKYSIPPKRIGTIWRYASIRVPTAHSPSTRTKMTTTTTKRELIPPSLPLGRQGSSPDNRRAGRQFSGYAEKPQVQGCSGRSELRYGRPADERRKDNKLCRKEKKYKAVTVKRRNVSKLPYYFLGADYADFKNSICIVRVIPRNPRLIL